MLAALAPPCRTLDVYLEHIEPLALDWPADGTMTDGYGPRWGRMHLGIDVGILHARSMCGPPGGTVTAAGWLTGYEGYGNVVTVDVGGGYSLLYAHLSVARSCRASGWRRATRSGRPGARARARARTCTSSCASTACRSTRSPIWGGDLPRSGHGTGAR